VEVIGLMKWLKKKRNNSSAGYQRGTDLGREKTVGGEMQKRYSNLNTISFALKKGGRVWERGKGRPGGERMYEREESRKRSKKEIENLVPGPHYGSFCCTMDQEGGGRKGD